jgi:ABC-2 type transport system permease protein
VSDLMKNNNEKKNIIQAVKDSFSGRKFRSGAYVTVISTIVVIIVVVVNMLVSKMDIQIDLSTQDIYTLSADTKGMVKGLTDDVTIYYMIEPGNETTVYQEIAKKYDSLSDKITVENKDPVLYPMFASEYVEDEVAQNSFIVVNNANNRAKYIDGGEMLIQEMNQETFQNETTGIDVEGKLTSAIQYVTATDLPVMYVVDGHGEMAITDSFSEALEKMNIKLQTIQTYSKSSIPDDCDILYINAPESDLTVVEAAMIKEYLIAGGNAIVTLDAVAEELPNFTSILEYFGIEKVNGIVMEGDANMHLTNYPHFLAPTIINHEITEQAISKQIPVIMPVTAGLLISDTKRSSLTVEPLLETSDTAYAKPGSSFKTYEKEEKDVDGPFYLGLAATDTYNDVTAKLVVYSTEAMFDVSTVNYGNSAILSGTIGFLSSGDMKLLSIPTKSVTPDYIYLTQEQAFTWGAVTVIFIPAFILIIGVMVSLRRRKR